MTALQAPRPQLPKKCVCMYQPYIFYIAAATIGRLDFCYDLLTNLVGTYSEVSGVGIVGMTMNAIRGPYT